MVEALGALAVSAMVVCYALEARSPVFVLLFAGACLAASGYAAAIRAWPFAAVELVFAGVAWQRFAKARVSAGTTHPSTRSTRR